MRTQHVVRIFMVALFLAVTSMPTGAHAQEVARISPEALNAMLSAYDLVVVDVRAGADWTSSAQKVKGAVREDPDSVASWTGKYPKDATIVLYCA